ncbi:MAG: hypothetical protein AB1635_08645 [Acidobacteriota bacterium]
MSSLGRALVLAAVVAAGAVAWWSQAGRDSSLPANAPRMAWVATASQLGVVGYRDPVGVQSPDGRRLAYAEGRHVRVVPVEGGLSVRMAPADGQVRHLAWHPAGENLLVQDGGAAVRWWLADVDGSGKRRPLWTTEVFQSADGHTVRANALTQLGWSPDGRFLSGVANGREGAEIWRIASDGTEARVTRPGRPVSWPTELPSGDIACVLASSRGGALSVPCGDDPMTLTPPIEVVGPLAVSPDGATIYFASPDGRGFVDLWQADRASGRARRLTSFGRDSYAPSVAADGSVLFRVQSYRTHAAEITLASGVQRQLATFQSETPSYDRSNRWVAVTYGTWRRVLDDVNYPDIAQEVGLVDTSGPLPARAPAVVIDASASEDQGMDWSPNGRWIVLHSHKADSDDVWIRPADGSGPERRLTFLGRGAEVGWPRWSPDGTAVLLDGASPSSGRSVLFVIGVSQETGETTSEIREVAVTGFDGELSHGEWLGGSTEIVAIAKEGPGRHAVVIVPAIGGAARVVHRFTSEHDFPGIAASPDGREIAFVAPAADGRYQIFVMPSAGGSPRQITVDATDKTQPAWSHDGTRVAFTVWSYQSQFWRLAP